MYNNKNANRHWQEFVMSSKFSSLYAVYHQRWLRIAGTRSAGDSRESDLYAKSLPGYIPIMTNQYQRSNEPLHKLLSKPILDKAVAEI